MYQLIVDRKPRNPAIKRYEVRIYRTWADVSRASTQLRKRGIYHVTFLEVNGPAIQLLEHV